MNAESSGPAKAPGPATYMSPSGRFLTERELEQRLDVKFVEMLRAGFRALVAPIHLYDRILSRIDREA